ncbi:MAG: FliA/WhiG family RNA polymerase sigma factor [Verrucomicrobia bacterium]|nr:FliA/WhiG family RNA polymerase sigma factor [Verrucomicrobiota bacterium]
MMTVALAEKRPLASNRVTSKDANPCRLPRRPAARAKAEAELVNHYLPLVKTVVGRIQMSLPPHVDPEDLYSAGLIGLLDAIRNYNPKLGSNFESYARVRIRGAAFDELRRMDWVPRSVHRKARKVQMAIQSLEQRKRRQPTAAELAVEMKLSLSEFHQLLDEIRPATFVCLDAAVNPESEDSPSQYETLADPHQGDPLADVARHEMAEQLADLIDRLPPAQKKVLALYYYEDMRLREIAEAFGLTESRICQIHSQAILNLKAQMKSLDLCNN